jgi:hypothetical protein
MSLHPQNAECPTCFRIIPLRSSDIKRDWYCRCDAEVGILDLTAEKLSDPMTKRRAA